MDFILDELLKYNLEWCEIYKGLDRDGERIKERLENVKCYIQDSQKVKYDKDKRQITLNAVIYIKGDPFKNIKFFDGTICVDGQEFKIVGGRKYKDIFGEDIVYTKLEVI